VAAGIANILVTGRGKNAIEDHRRLGGRSFLEARGKREQLAEIRKIST
jgi:UTP-glucose-1-phosphate uridylyltransferase